MAPIELAEANLAEIKRLFRPWLGILGLRNGWQLNGDGLGWNFQRKNRDDLLYWLCYEPPANSSSTGHANLTCSESLHSQEHVKKILICPEGCAYTHDHNAIIMSPNLLSGRSGFFTSVPGS